MSRFGPPRSILGSTWGRLQQVGMREWGESKTGRAKNKVMWMRSEQAPTGDPPTDVRESAPWRQECWAIIQDSHPSLVPSPLQVGRVRHGVLGVGCCQHAGRSVCSCRWPSGFGQGVSATPPHIFVCSCIRDAGSLQIFSHSGKQLSGNTSAAESLRTVIMKFSGKDLCSLASAENEQMCDSNG